MPAAARGRDSDGRSCGPRNRRRGQRSGRRA